MTRLAVISEEELAALVRAAVREGVSAALERARAPAVEWMDADAVARALGVHARTVTKLAKRGELPASRIGKLWRFARADVDAFLAARRAG